MNNTSLYYPLVDNTVQMVNCRFLNNVNAVTGADYTYKCELVDVKVGDLVVVEQRGTYSVVRVTKLNVPLPVDQEDITFRWIVSHVNLVEHVGRLEFEDDLIDRVTLARAENMRSSLLRGLGLTSEQAKCLLTSVSFEKVDDWTTDDDLNIGDDDEEVHVSNTTHSPHEMDQLYEEKRDEEMDEIHLRSKFPDED